MDAEWLEQAVENLLGELGFELVAVERGGARNRPLIRIRMDRPGSEPGRSLVTAADCARANRAVREFLDGSPEAPADYILEVSSPGVERPLVRPADYERFAGREVSLRGYGTLAGRGKQITGRLLGLRGDDRVAVEVSGDELEVGLSEIAKARLVFRWEDEL